MTTDLRLPQPPSPPLPTARCPHCSAVAAIAPSSALRYVCAICGLARIPFSATDVPGSAETTASLAAASAAHRAVFLWGGGAILAGLFGIAALGVLATIFVVVHPTGFTALVATLLALIPSYFTAFSLIRQRRARRQLTVALDTSWSLAVRDLIDEGPPLTVAQAASRLQLPEEDAERLLIRASARGLVRSDVADDGDLRFATKAERHRAAASRVSL